jgi:hypothetical protein
MARVKFRPRLSGPAGSLMMWREAKETAALAEASAPPQDAPGRPNSNWAPGYRIQQAGIIRTGPLIGLPIRRPTDRTRALTIEQVRELTNAAAFARAIGRPLNAMLTVAWQGSALFTEETWPSLQTAVMDRLTRHLQRRAVQTAFVWTRERIFGRGAHTHVMLHLGPQPTRQVAELVAYIEAKFRFEPGAIDLKMGDYGAHTPPMQAGLLRYVLKGIDHRAFVYFGSETVNVGAALGIDHRGQQGVVEIKRAGVSQSLSPAARKREGWREIRDFGALARVLNPERAGERQHRRVAGRGVPRGTIAPADAVSGERGAAP